MSDKPIPSEIVRADQVNVGDRIVLCDESVEVKTIERGDYYGNGERIQFNERGVDNLLVKPSVLVARLLPEPVEVLEFWRVTRTDPAGEEWIDDLIDRESAVREAREYLKAWKDRPGHTATVAFVRETVMSPEEVKL